MTRTVIQADDIASGAIPEAGFTSVQTFTSSGTWTKPSGITKVIVFVTGAGVVANQYQDNSEAVEVEEQ